MTKALRIGGFDHVKAVCIGGGNPVVIQTMWKDRLSFSDVRGESREALIKRITDLDSAGCGLIRFAVPDIESAQIIGALAAMVSVPICADIHFDYNIALRCLDFPIAKLRINPGNIGIRSRIEAVLSKAMEKRVPIRIGVNAGSLPADLRRLTAEGMETAEALVLAAERELAVFQEFGFADVLVSMKASGIADTIQANRLLSHRTDVPLHIGLTEAGPLVPGAVRNTAALLCLLCEGIGDTIRVSLSDTVENEVIAAREILGAAAEYAGSSETQGRLRQPGVRIVSCPRCGRSGFDPHFAERWMSRFYSIKKNISIAIMGCEVNGPGEARHADIGITGAGDSVIIYRQGKVIKTLKTKDNDEIDRAFEEELKKALEAGEGE
jgi:(E)-4-hydroxy-3-methylbut-2-enyl-diphosphate synthase